MKKSLVHAVAECQECDFYDGYFLTACSSGRKHAIKTGHKVTIETGYVLIYNEGHKNKKV